LDRFRESMQRGLDWNQVAETAVFPAFDAVLFERVTPQWRWDLAFAAVTEMSQSWRPDLAAVCDWVVGRLDTDRDGMPDSLRLALAELLVHRGDAPRARSALDALAGGAPDALRACLLVQAGRWNDAKLAFGAAIKLRQAEVGARKRIYPASMAWLYPLCLLAQQTPQHLEIARKFCIGEAGSRDPSPHDAWGCGRSDRRAPGEVALERRLFASERAETRYPRIELLWRLLLAVGSAATRSARRNPAARSAMP
jgi:hypothetical protein